MAKNNRLSIYSQFPGVRIDRALVWSNGYSPEWSLVAAEECEALWTTVYCPSGEIPTLARCENLPFMMDDGKFWFLVWHSGCVEIPLYNYIKIVKWDCVPPLRTMVLFWLGMYHFLFKFSHMIRRRYAGTQCNDWSAFRDGALISHSYSLLHYTTHKHS